MTTQTVDVRQPQQSHDARVGEHIMTFMFRARISQTALSERVGMTQAALSKKLHGERKWSLNDLYSVATSLGVSVTDLLDGPKPHTDDDSNVRLSD